MLINPRDRDVDDHAEEQADQDCDQTATHENNYIVAIRGTVSGVIHLKNPDVFKIHRPSSRAFGGDEVLL